MTVSSIRSSTIRSSTRRSSRRLPDAARVTREAHGRFAEMIAALTLMARGYRLVARRHRNRYGEIDLIGVRGRRVAFVEVKFRASAAEAEQTLADLDPSRLHAAAEHWWACRPHYADHEIGFDAILIVPWRWPSYRRDALQPTLGR
jgi:putative endonuclease